MDNIIRIDGKPHFNAYALFEKMFLDVSFGMDIINNHCKKVKYQEVPIRNCVEPYLDEGGCYVVIENSSTDNDYKLFYALEIFKIFRAYEKAIQL